MKRIDWMAGEGVWNEDKGGVVREEKYDKLALEKVGVCH